MNVQWHQLCGCMIFPRCDNKIFKASENTPHDGNHVEGTAKKREFRSSTRARLGEEENDKSGRNEGQMQEVLQIGQVQVKTRINMQQLTEIRTHTSQRSRLLGRYFKIE